MAPLVGFVLTKFDPGEYGHWTFNSFECFNRGCRGRMRVCSAADAINVTVHCLRSTNTIASSVTMKEEEP